MEQLIGRKINKIEVDQTKEYINIHTDKGLLYVMAYGDCCSHSWFEHLDGLNALIDSTVTEVEHVYGGDEDSEDYECLQLYFLKITTDKGRSTIEMRNSSNGYYGGSFEVKEKPSRFYDELKFTELKEDF